MWNRVKWKGTNEIANSVSLATLPMKKFLQDLSGNDFSVGSTGDDCELEVKSNPKFSKRRKKIRMLGGDVLQFLASILHEVLSGRDLVKSKDNGVRNEAMERLNSVDSSFQAGQREFDDNAIANREKQISVIPAPKDDQEDAMVKLLPKKSLDASLEISGMSLGNIKGNSREMVKSGRSGIKTRNTFSSAHLTENGNISSHSREDKCDHNVLSDKEYLQILNRDYRIMSMQESYHDVVLQHRSQKTAIGRQEGRMHDYAESQFNSRVRENEMVSFSDEANASLKSRNTAEVHDKANFPTNDKVNGKIMRGILR